MSISPSEWMLPEFLAKHLHPILKKHDIKWRGHGHIYHIYIDHQNCNIMTANIVLSELSVTLSVPKEPLRKRLIELGWLNDDRRISLARDHIPKTLKD